MMTQQEFCEKLSFEEETSDHKRSILLVDTMNAIGFSKSEREIHRHSVHLMNVLENTFGITDTQMSKLTHSLYLLEELIVYDRMFLLQRTTFHRTPVASSSNIDTL
jgi:hypothetical protein